jgi:hypothetical protein
MSDFEDEEKHLRDEDKAARILKDAAKDDARGAR